MSRSRASRPGQPELVGKLLPDLLRRKGLTARIEAASALTEWPDRVGPQIAAVTQPRRIADTTLFVAVATSAWMMELNLMKGELLRRINAGKDEGRIKQIIFVVNGD